MSVFALSLSRAVHSLHFPAVKTGCMCTCARACTLLVLCLIALIHLAQACRRTSAMILPGFAMVLVGFARLTQIFSPEWACPPGLAGSAGALRQKGDREGNQFVGFCEMLATKKQMYYADFLVDRFIYDWFLVRSQPLAHCRREDNYHRSVA